MPPGLGQQPRKSSHTPPARAHLTLVVMTRSHEATTPRVQGACLVLHSVPGTPHHAWLTGGVQPVSVKYMEGNDHNFYSKFPCG